MEEVSSSILDSSTTKRCTGGPADPWQIAGFVGGEGCFSITRKQPAYADGSTRLRFLFSVQVASRDHHMLVSLGDAIGCGSIRQRPPGRKSWLPSSVFSVSGLRSHRSKVIPFFERHRLWGHKRDQFEAWVREMDAHELAHPSRWGKGPSPCAVEDCERPVRGRGLCRSHYYEATGY